MIMHASALNHFLTPTEREVFERTGYLIIHDAIESSLHRRLLEVVDRVDTRERQPEHGTVFFLSPMSSRRIMRW